MRNLYKTCESLINKGLKKSTRIFLVLSMVLVFPFLSKAQVTTTELFNFGVDNASMNYWSWNSADFTIVENPAGDTPSTTVRKWQKGGNWTGFGATFNEPLSLEGATKVSLWIYSDQQPISFIVAQIKNETGETIIDKNITVDFPAETWSLLEVEFESTTSLCKDILFMPDGNVAESVGTNYFVAQLLLESEEIEPTAKNITANYSGNISIDGVLSDWDNIESTEINIPSNGSIIDNSDDFTANFKAVWDDANIYLNVNVTDNELDNTPSENAWNLDGMEIAFNMVNLETYSLVDMLNDDDEGKVAIVYGDNADSTRSAKYRKMDMLTELSDDYKMVCFDTEKG